MLRSTEIKIVFTLFRWAVIMVLLVSSYDFISGGFYLSALLTLAAASLWTTYFGRMVRKRGDFRLVASLRLVLTVLFVMTAITFSGYLKAGAPEPFLLETAQDFIP